MPKLVSSDALRSFIIIGIGCSLLWLYASGKLRSSLTIAGITILCLADMWGVNKRYLNDAQFVPPLHPYGNLHQRRIQTS